MAKIKKWSITTPKEDWFIDKRVEIQTDTVSGVRVWVDSDDVSPKDTAKVVRSIARLPRLLEMERIIRQMFTEGSLDPHPTSDTSDEYRLKKLCRWKDPAAGDEEA